jgi:hypothetical protein
MKTYRLLLVLPWFMLPQPIDAAQVTLSASTLTATIAEHVELRLIVRSLENVDEIRVAIPAGDYEIIRRQSQPTIKTAEWRTFERIFTIAFFKTGDFTVGPLDVELLSAKTVREKEKSGTVSIRIRSLLSEKDKDIRPLKRLLPIRGNPLHLLKFFAAAGLLLAVTLLIFKRKKAKKNPTPIPALPAPEIELELRARELWQKKLPQKGEHKLFFILLGEIVKHFLARVYRFNADELTSMEIVGRLRNSEKDSSIVLGLETIFQQADLVKFARQVPGPEAIRALAEKIAALIGAYKARRILENEVQHVQTGR